MRTNIDIDEGLMTEAMEATGQTTKRGVVEEGLRRIVDAHRRRRAWAALEGMGWEGDLDQMRDDFLPEES